MRDAGPEFSQRRRGRLWHGNTDGHDDRFPNRDDHGDGRAFSHGYGDLNADRNRCAAHRDVHEHVYPGTDSDRYRDQYGGANGDEHTRSDFYQHRGVNSDGNDSEYRDRRADFDCYGHHRANRHDRIDGHLHESTISNTSDPDNHTDECADGDGGAPDRHQHGHNNEHRDGGGPSNGDRNSKRHGNPANGNKDGNAGEHAHGDEHGDDGATNRHEHNQPVANGHGNGCQPGVRRGDRPSGNDRWQ